MLDADRGDDGIETAGARPAAERRAARRGAPAQAGAAGVHRAAVPAGPVGGRDRRRHGPRPRARSSSSSCGPCGRWPSCCRRRAMTPPRPVTAARRRSLSGRHRWTTTGGGPTDDHRDVGPPAAGGGPAGAARRRPGQLARLGRGAGRPGVAGPRARRRSSTPPTTPSGPRCGTGWSPRPPRGCPHPSYRLPGRGRAPRPGCARRSRPWRWPPSSAGVGAAAASTRALPGDTLYGLKRQLEDGQLALARGDVGHGRELLEQADARLGEAERAGRRRGRQRPGDPGPGRARPCATWPRT